MQQSEIGPEQAIPTLSFEALSFSHRELMWCLRVQRRLHHRAVTQTLTAVSRLGNGVFWYVLMLGIWLSGVLLHVPHAQEAALRMAVMGVVGVLLYKWLKRLTSRPRPCARNGEVVALTAPLDEFSFPSGHTLHAVSFSMVAIAFFPLLAVVLVPFTLLVALSRVVLGLHYPSDVAAGALIGMALAAVTLWV